MKKFARSFLTILVCLPAFIALSVYAENNPGENTAPLPSIVVEGRIAKEILGKKEELILHAKNAETFILTGALTEQLKKILGELGDKNFVMVSGKVVKYATSICSETNSYEMPETGERYLKTTMICINYHRLEVSEIISSQSSDLVMPPPKRDLRAERQMGSYRDSLPKASLGQIYGKITDLKLQAKSPLKTVEITNLASGEPLRKVNLIITSQSKIGKEIDKDTRLILGMHALKIGQEVMAIYFKDELKAELATITILKE